MNKAYNAVWRRDLWVGTYRGYFDASGASVSVKELHSEIQIDAPAERVWKLLTDFDSYPQWNPFIRNIGGLPAPGERLEVLLHHRAA